MDVFGENAAFESDDENTDNFNRFYPDDLEKLIYFIRTISKACMNKSGTTNIP